MKRQRHVNRLFGLLLMPSIAGIAIHLSGCGEPLPEKPKPTGGMASPAMAEQRIKDTLANPRFTQDQKDQIIATIKQRNHMQ